MPREFIPQAHKREHQADAKKVPEATNRMVHREVVHDRRVTKQKLRTCVAFNESHWPAAV